MNGGASYDFGDVVLQSGATLRGARVAYKTFGTLNATKTNAIIYPTSFGAHHSDLEWLIGVGKALDPSKYFIVIPNMFGNGLSSSPSDVRDWKLRREFPRITMYDNVTLQHRFLRSHFDVQKIALVVGFSMGGQQTFHWGALFPDFVERIAPITSSAKTAQHNLVFLEGIKAALTLDPAWRDGVFAEQPIQGIRAMARVYAGWGLSQAFYREGSITNSVLRRLTISSNATGKLASCDVTATTFSPCSGPGSTPISATIRSTTATSRRHCGAFARARSLCRAQQICTFPSKIA